MSGEQSPILEDLKQNLEQIQNLRAIVERAQHTILVTGAGMSKGCGVPVLHTSMRGRPFHKWFTRRAFIEDPIWFFDVYRDIISQWSDIQPNQAYTCIAQAGIPVITQNIDGLHIRAGSKSVIELHGNVRELKCDDCGNLFPSTLIRKEGTIPTCPACVYGIVRPNIVFEGEEVHHFAQAVDLAGKADLLVIVGTQLRMEPCNQLPRIVRENGGKVLEVNAYAERWIPKIFNIK